VVAKCLSKDSGNIFSLAKISKAKAPTKLLMTNQIEYKLGKIFKKAKIKNYD